MLTKPNAGWSDFQLEGTSEYGLSYLDDIAFDWLTQAIHGLETMMPFCVKGFMEPDRFLCTVSYWNCHIVREDESSCPLKKERVINEISHTSMLQFCKYLYDDISNNIDEWATFVDYYEYDDDDTAKRKKTLIIMLEQLKKLISEKEVCFGKNSIFL